ISHMTAARGQFVAHELGPLEAAACSVLPLGFRRQFLAGPGGVGLGVLVCVCTTGWSSRPWFERPRPPPSPPSTAERGLVLGIHCIRPTPIPGQPSPGYTIRGSSHSPRPRGSRPRGRDLHRKKIRRVSAPISS